jgi:carboxyl-terminal processing protease
MFQNDRAGKCYILVISLIHFQICHRILNNFGGDCVICNRMIAIDKMKRILYVAFLVGFVAMPLACDKNEDPAHPNEYVNDWIFENMQFWYYWNSTIPAEPDKTIAHEEFFKSLLNSQDRFSWIQEDFQELLNSLQGVTLEAGFEFVLYRESEGSNTLIAQILYIKPNSPAAASGLNRGDIITKINNQGITVDNYKSLLDQLGEPFTISYKALDMSNQQFGSEQSLSLQVAEYSENPNFLHQVFTYDNHKIGYYVYNLFATGPSSNSLIYNNEMDQIFADFKAQGITDFILDLRFNSGGAESATNNLASLIGKGVSNSKIFTKRQYNEGVTKAIKEDPDLGESFLSVKFINKTQNIGSQLNLSRVYILTGSRSASASELLINGLRPYMDVFLIGNKTVGKNLGSISLYQKNDPENTWGMQPIVTKSFNSLDQSDYDTGFNPQIFDADNSLYLYPLGNPNERLLNRALKEITGLAVIGRVDQKSWASWGEEIGHSLDSLCVNNSPP